MHIVIMRENINVAVQLGDACQETEERIDGIEKYLLTTSKRCDLSASHSTECQSALESYTLILDSVYARK